MSYRGDRGRGRGRGRGDRGGGRGGDRGGGRGGPRGFGGGAGGLYSPPGVASNVDPRLTDNSAESVVLALSKLQINDNDLPIRPGFGTTGVQVKLRSNFFPVRVPKGSLFDYDVAIQPSATIRRVKRRIFELAEQTAEWSSYGLTGRVAHDYSSKLVSASQLPEPLVIRIRYFEEDEPPPKPGSREKVYTLSFTQTGTLNTQELNQYLMGQPGYRGYDPLPIIQALNIILTTHANRSGGVQVGRNRFFFPTSTQAFDLGGGLQAFRGYFSSVRPTHRQLMVNVNACTTAFYTPGNLATAMIAFKDASFGANMTGFVRNVRVKTKHLGYKKTVKKVAHLNAQQYTFQSDKYGSVSVAEYFKKEYKINLRYPLMPLVDVGGQKATYLPPEVCEILPGQAFKGKLSDQHTAEMIKYAARPPRANAEAICGEGLDKMGFAKGKDPLTQFGIAIGTQMTVVPGRILPAPSLEYGGKRDIRPEDAGWNLRNIRFAQGGKFPKAWVVVALREGPPNAYPGSSQELQAVVKGFVSKCNECGMQVTDPSQYLVVNLPQKTQDDPCRSRIYEVIRSNIINNVKAKPSFILFTLPSGDKHVYATIKYLCDVNLDIHSSCVHWSKFQKSQPQYFANVALKLNMKFGGVNHILDTNSMNLLRAKRTMLVGIDVTHPGPGSVNGTPSIAAVVANIDDKYGQFPASMEIQESKKEMVTNLASMMVERLLLFKAHNKSFPEHVLVYRDGVSEGQFPIVVNEEMPEIKKAFKKAKCNAKLTIVICGKRHHTRFFPTDADGADDKGNPKPGTVVDRGVTAIYEFDFFLQAHKGLQGTTKPTHYYVVHDEIQFSADALQIITNNVSYMFARATKAVSLISPAYYADLCCERGRCYLHPLLQGYGASASTSGSGNDDVVMDEAKRFWKDGVHKNLLKDTMYYL